MGETKTIKLERRKPIAVVCHSRRFFDDWLNYGSVNGIDKGKFVFVNRPEHCYGHEFYHIITIGEYFRGYHDVLEVLRTRLR
ncbi:MAG: hypothetical protein QNJ81_02100 [Acidimicrobiia bacterium]|nr:hypothetical protein [Acidimicrobiia bacterium]